MINTKDHNENANFNSFKDQTATVTIAATAAMVVSAAMKTAAEASVRTASKVMSTAVESSAVMTASCHFYYPLRFSIPYDIR